MPTPRRSGWPTPDWPASAAVTGGPARALEAVRGPGPGAAARGYLSGARADLQSSARGLPVRTARSRVLADLAMLALGADDLRRAAELAELALVEAGADRTADGPGAGGSQRGRHEPGPARSGGSAGEPQRSAAYTELGDSRGAARILDARAMATFLHGDIRTGTELLDRAAHLFEDSGDLMRTVTPRSTRGHGLVLLDQAAAGLADARRALEIARTLGHPEGQAYALWHCAEALAVLGRADEAVAAGEEARSIGHTDRPSRLDGDVLAGHRSGSTGRRGPRGSPSSVRAVLALANHLDLFACWAAARAALVHVALGPIRRRGAPGRSRAGSRTGTGPARGAVGRRRIGGGSRRRLS